MADEIAEMNPKDKDLAPTCEVCGKPFDTETAIVRCNSCKTFHHLDCWQYNRGCAVYACNGRMYDRLEPNEQLALVDPELQGKASFTVCQPAQPFSALTFVIVLFLLLVSIPGGIAILKALMFPKALGVLWLLVATMGMIFFPVLFQTFYYKLECSPQTKMISRQPFLYGYEMGDVEEEWLATAHVVEIHYHRNPFLHGRVQEQLYLVLDDGSRVLIEDNFRQLINGPKYRSTKIEELAQRLAEFTDTTIRVVQGLEAPPVEEVLESARARAIITEKDDQSISALDDSED